MSLFNLQMPRSYADGRTYFAAYIDEQKVAVEEWAQQMVYNLSQLALDIFGTSYSYGSQGLATRATSVIDAFAAIAENEAITGSWTFSGTSIFSGVTSLYNGNNLTVYSDAGITSKFSVAGTTGNTVVGGTLGVTGNSTFTGTLTLNGAITGANAKLYSGYDLIGYSDVGSTETCRLDTSTGEIKLANVDPPNSNYLNQNSGVKAYAYFYDTIGFYDNYNIDSIADDDGDGIFQVYLDLDMHASLSSQFVVIGSPTQTFAPTFINAVSLTPGSTDQVGVEFYQLTENINTTSEIERLDGSFSFAVYGDLA